MYLCIHVHWTVRLLQATAPFKYLPVAHASCLCPYIFLQPHPRPVATYSSGVPSVCPTEPKETPKSSYSAKYFLKTLNSGIVMTGNTSNCQNSLNLFPSMDFQSSCWSIATTEEWVTTMWTPASEEWVHMDGHDQSRVPHRSLHLKSGQPCGLLLQWASRLRHEYAHARECYALSQLSPSQDLRLKSG